MSLLILFNGPLTIPPAPPLAPSIAHPVVAVDPVTGRVPTVEEMVAIAFGAVPGKVVTIDTPPATSVLPLDKGKTSIQ